MLNTQEDKVDDEIGLVYSVNGKPAITDKVYNNKITKLIYLEDLGNILLQEPDGVVELYFKCKYNEEEAKLPDSSSLYLKVKKLEPLVIFVNGYWNVGYIQKDLLNFSDGKSLEGYWGNQLKDRATKYINTPIKNMYFLNGASTSFSSGGERYNNGAKLANERFSNKEPKFFKTIFKNKRDILIVSQSMGGAYAEGVLSVLKSKKVDVVKVVHLSPADVSGFAVNYPDRTYQIDIDYDPVLMYKNLNDRNFIKGIQYSGLVKTQMMINMGMLIQNQRGLYGTGLRI